MGLRRWLRRERIFKQWPGRYERSYKRGYTDGRSELGWKGPHQVDPDHDAYYRGWNLGQRVTRRLRVNQ